MRLKRLCTVATSALLAVSISVAPALAAPDELSMGETELAPVSTTSEMHENGVANNADSAVNKDDKAATTELVDEASSVTATPQDVEGLEAQADRIDIANATVDPISVKSYTGSEIKPKPVVKYDGATLVEGTDYTLTYANNTNETTEALIIITGKGAYNGSQTIKFEITGKGSGVIYQTQIQNIGWQGWRTSGVMSGTEGQSLRLEGVQIALADAPLSGGIEYRTHVQNSGWETKWAKDGATSGTVGKSLRLECIQIQLTGKMREQYNVWYRVHAQDVGWMGWTNNGKSAGTTGYSRRLEALEVMVLPIDAPAPGNTDDPFKFAITYRTHVQNVGWQSLVSDGATSGTEGKSLRLEGIEINVDNSPYKGKVQYMTHIENIGWESAWKSNGEMSGTSGKSLRLEAIRIRLTDDLADHYDVWYRVHAQDVGWMGWTKNDESPAGTAGYARRLEAIQIELVSKGGAAPGPTDNPYLVKN